jgi:hypothetical protein
MPVRERVECVLIITPSTSFVIGDDSRDRHSENRATSSCRHALVHRALLHIHSGAHKTTTWQYFKRVLLTSNVVDIQGEGGDRVNTNSKIGCAKSLFVWARSFPNVCGACRGIPGPAAVGSDVNLLGSHSPWQRVFEVAKLVWLSSLRQGGVAVPP